MSWCGNKWRLATSYLELQRHKTPTLMNDRKCILISFKTSLGRELEDVHKKLIVILFLFQERLIRKKQSPKV